MLSREVWVDPIYYYFTKKKYHIFLKLNYVFTGRPSLSWNFLSLLGYALPRFNFKHLLNKELLNKELGQDFKVDLMIEFYNNIK